MKARPRREERGGGTERARCFVALALGRRGESTLVRTGAAQAVVTATFDTPPAVAALLTGNGLEIDHGEPLIIRRLVKADGGSRAFVNDQPASATLLREIAPLLVEIHGQHDDRGLLAAAGHRALLDSYAGGGVRDVAGAYAACVRGLAAAEPMMQRLHEIDMPALFLTGELDPAAPPKLMREMHAHVRGAWYVEIPGAAHLPNLQRPDAFNDALLAFLKHGVDWTRR